MDVGIQTLFSSHGWDGITDGQVYREDTALALLAEELGFDVVWAVEHHFYDYSFCPDNTEWLGLDRGPDAPNVDVGTAAVIMPWNEPLRVAEKVALLDHIAEGRLRFGMGRGLSRREYSHFRGIEMDESRDRFDEGSAMVVEALQTGFIEGDGPVLPAAPHADPARSRALVRGPHLRRGHVGRLDRGGRPAEGGDGDVRRPVVEEPAPVDREVAGHVPGAARRGAPAPADL